jgi:hypothetical protein
MITIHESHLLFLCIILVFVTYLLFSYFYKCEIKYDVHYKKPDEQVINTAKNTTEHLDGENIEEINPPKKKKKKKKPNTELETFTINPTHSSKYNLRYSRPYNRITHVNNYHTHKENITNVGGKTSAHAGTILPSSVYDNHDQYNIDIIHQPY